MSKKKPAQQTTFNAGSKVASTRSDGYTQFQEERTDLDGYWVPERGPIHGKLISAFQFIARNGKSRGKTLTVFVFDIADPCVALVKLDGGGKDEDTLQPRSLVGVISSYGLRHLVMLGGCFVKIERKGKKTLGNGNEAWHYDIAHKPVKGRTLDVRPPLASAGSSNGAPSREPGDDTEEVTAQDLPF